MNNHFLLEARNGVEIDNETATEDLSMSMQYDMRPMGRGKRTNENSHNTMYTMQGSNKKMQKLSSNASFDTEDKPKFTAKQY
jgi:hypothetical protein